MINIVLPDNSQRRLVFYLAMEEYIAKHIHDIIPADEAGNREAFFMWQVPPTVIFGRNQVMEAEVNLPYCKEKNIQLYRRKSGGGCVYADWGNVMLSYISDSTNVMFTFEKYLSQLALALRKTGLNAERSGRNDVLVDGKKVSGNAFFLSPTASIIHGTMLYNSDFEELERAITPSDAKIQSKGVASVRQHVTNVKERYEALENKLIPGMEDIEKFKAYILNFFCGEKKFMLTDDMVKEIDKIEAEYLDPDFLSGKNHKYSLEKSAKLEGIGEISLCVEMLGENIESCHLKGDYFTLKGSVDDLLNSKLAGKPFTREAFEEALKDTNLQEHIMNMTTAQFIDIAFTK